LRLVDVEGVTTATVETLATAGLPLRTLCLNECLNVTDAAPLLDLLKGKAAGSLVELGLAQVPCVDNDVALVRVPRLPSICLLPCRSFRPVSEKPESSPTPNSTGD
jgi:hypothetical protein